MRKESKEARGGTWNKHSRAKQGEESQNNVYRILLRF